VTYNGPVARPTAQVVSRADSRLDRVGWTAFEYAPFRLYIASMLCATSGIFLFNAALGWYVLQVTGSAAAVGLVFTASGLPILLLMPQAGVLTDRFGSRSMLIANFVALAVVGVTFGAVAFGTAPSFPMLLGLAVLFGVAETIGSPATMSIVNDLVPPSAVSSATALNFLHMNVARIIGGLLSGLILAATSPALAFFIAAILFAVPVATLFRVRTKPAHPREERSSTGFLGPLLEASRYAKSNPTLGVLIVLAIAPGAIGLSYIFMLPVAAEELGIGAAGLGALMVAVGIGGLIAGVSLETIQRRIGHGRALFCGIFGAAIGLTAFGLVPGVPLAIAVLPIVGASFLTFAAANLTLTQAISPARLRGRMVGLFATLYWGMMPVGGIIVGLAAEQIGARSALALCGVGLAIAGVAALFVRPQLATLAVGRDGVTLSGDLRGSGAEHSELGAPVLDSQRP
jgi:MFS family permease